LANKKLNFLIIVSRDWFFIHLESICEQRIMYSVFDFA